MAKQQRLLLIAPPPYQGSGSRVKFDLLFEYLGNFSNLIIHYSDLPVFSPLYNANGTPGPLSHIRTILRLSRVAIRVPRSAIVVVCGTSDFCFSYGLAIAFCSRLFRRRCIAILTGGRGVFGTQRLPKLARTICLAVMQAFDTFIVQTEVARNDLPAQARTKAVVVKNFRPRLPDMPSTRRDDGGRIRFAFVSGPDLSTTERPAKGLDLLLDAFDRSRAALGPDECMELHIYGPILPSLIERVAKTPSIIVHGLLPSEQLRVNLGKHDVLAFPSRYVFEGHPGAIIEAFMAGLPVIASDLPGPLEIVKHEVNGLVVRAGDWRAFAAAMNRLATDHELRRRLASGAWASASDFDLENVLPRLVTILGLPACIDPKGRRSSVRERKEQ